MDLEEFLKSVPGIHDGNTMLMWHKMSQSVFYEYGRNGPPINIKLILLDPKYGKTKNVVYDLINKTGKSLTISCFEFITYGQTKEIIIELPIQNWWVFVVPLKIKYDPLYSKLIKKIYENKHII